MEDYELVVGDAMKFTDVFRQIRTWGIRGVVKALQRLPHERSIRRCLLQNASRHANTKPRKGITVIAPISGAYSLSKTMRDFVVRLQKVGVPHQVFDTYKYDGKVAREDYEPLLTPKSEFNVLKYEFVVEMLTSPLPTGLPVKRCRIAFWEGESGLLDVFPYLKDSHAVVAMSDFNAAYFRRVIPARIKVEKVIYPLMPMPLGVLAKENARKRFGIGRGDFVVFYNFDIRADYRKNPQGTLEAFSSAFKGVESCKLVLKVNGVAAFPEKLSLMKESASRLGIARQLVVITEYLSQLDLYSLTNACDAYLSLHRGEGFGLGIAEAMQLSKPVVVTAYSAPLEFCNGETALLVPYKLVSMEGDALSARIGPCAEPDVVMAAAALRRIYGDKAFADEIGDRGCRFVKEHFSDAAFKMSVENLMSSV